MDIKFKEYLFINFELERKVVARNLCCFSWPDPSQHSATNSRCLQDMANRDTSANDEDNEAILKEEMEEKDDSDYLERTRAMDEYKDTHRRGWGNRANRS